MPLPLGQTVRFSRFALSSAAAFALCVGYAAPAAAADGAFLLQLGSYGSEKEALRQWKSLRNANRDVLGNLKPHVSAVALPPENKTSYRIQAGPLETRSEAATICGTLAERRTSCYVVETAFSLSEASPEMAGDLPIAEQPAEPSTTVTSFGAQPAAALEPAAELTAAPAPAAAAEDEDDKPGFFGRLFGSSPTNESRAAAPVAAVEATDMPNPGKTSLSTTGSRARQASMSPAEARNSAFFRGALTMSSEEAAPAPAPAPIAVSSSPAAARRGASTPFAMAAAPAPAPVEAAPAAEAAPASATAKEKRGFFGRLFGSSEQEAAPEVAAATVEEAPRPAAKGDVEVAEAIRVPVGSGTGATTRYVAVLPEAAAAPATAAKGAQATAQENAGRIFWAQVSYFNNESEAHTFYDEFKTRYPQLFDGVRIRITRPFAARRAKVSLRMGPFASANDVANICGAAQSENMRCTVIRDVAADAPLQLAPEATPQPRRQRTQLNSRYMAAAEAKAQPATAQVPVISDTGVGGRWVQLGSFPTAQAAYDHWKALQAAKPELASLKSTITSALGASDGNRFRLRAGPIAGDAAADSLCTTLSQAGQECDVIGAR